MKKGLYFFAVLCLMIFFRKEVFNTLFRYEIINERRIYKFNNENSKDKLIKYNSENIDQIIDNELKETSEILNFSFGKCENNPNKLITSKNANCIGYAGFLASSIQNKLELNHLNKDWRAEHKVVEIYFLNININKYLRSNFLKNHDFVMVRNLKTKEQITIDATLYDYLKINRIVLKN